MSIAPLAIEFLDWKLIYLTIGHHGNTVASGDSRAKIVSEYNDTFAELRSVAPVRSFGWAMPCVGGFCKGEKSGENLLGARKLKCNHVCCSNNS